MKQKLASCARFGDFTLDVRTGELHGNGQSVLLGQQVFQILLILVEREGDLVSRDELRKMLWPNDTVVEFEHGINNSIKKLRRALDDSAEEPKYVGTIPRRGYRLLVSVEWIGGKIASDESPASDSDTKADPKPSLKVGTLTGKIVSHYRVLELIGGGGMGMVYKAEDIKLGRRVGLKFLPEELADDPESLRRFEREACTASSLNHSNICSIYEFGEHEGQPFLVMELLEGETLRDRLAELAARHSRMPVDDVMTVAIQIAEGLEAAHEQGIIHRDIKPANIFLTKKGPTKILDFGLAKLAALESQVDHADREQSACGSQPLADARGPAAEYTLTRTGTAMGTAGYMSPEQVRGEKLDSRTDLFSFGLVLYEMACGQRAFTGETAAILKDSILHRIPTPIRELNTSLPIWSKS
jgi:serine/threonine protein kinase